MRSETGRVLSRWRDAGWGKVVADGKQAGRFGDELVEAVAEMIQQRWRPEPMPTWVTCIPSRDHPELVPDFTRRLAQRLCLPFHLAITKLRNNEQQKFQQNRYHQCSNLDGVFGVGGQLPAGPVLLLDDMVDSAWALTVAAILLRQAGCPAVLDVGSLAASWRQQPSISPAVVYRPSLDGLASSRAPQMPRNVANGSDFLRD
ncbi:hypothetical protein FHR53_000566 [Xanthomonas arboricola]